MFISGNDCRQTKGGSRLKPSTAQQTPYLAAARQQKNRNEAGIYAPHTHRPCATRLLGCASQSRQTATSCTMKQHVPPCQDIFAEKLLALYRFCHSLYIQSKGLFAISAAGIPSTWGQRSTSATVGWLYFIALAPEARAAGYARLQM